MHLKIDLRLRGPVISVDKLTAPHQARLLITADFRASCTLPIFSITSMKSPLSDRLSGQSREGSGMVDAGGGELSCLAGQSAIRTVFLASPENEIPETTVITVTKYLRSALKEIRRLSIAP